jgi:hypothetical protein
MGYYVQIDNSNFTIPADKLDEAFELLKALNHKPGVEKRGGSFGGGKQSAAWFSWMTENYDETSKDAADIFQQLGFETELNEAGDLLLTGYDSKTGQEDLFLAEILHLATDGSEIQWRGEDGSIWKTTKTGVKTGHYVFDE